ncbi:hypothetical protein [Pigmentiphaga sp.]|uniref:hypothetical protein n=1 Tax=Pigmentiphaga sp. TaxID=1977564 RepID=UPI0025FD671B|nr:hypothetical protein [Pigmentiphaga sp.]
MSSMTITTVTFNPGDYHGNEQYGGPGNCGGHRPPGPDVCDIDNHGVNNRGGDFVGNGNAPTTVIVIGMPPEMANGYPGQHGNGSPQAPTFLGVGQGCYLNACAGNHVPQNSEEQFAVKTIDDFLKKHNLGPLSLAQLTEIAEKGTLNGKPLPGTEDEQYDVRLAASIYTANDGALFNRVGSNYPDQSSQMSEDEAVGVIEKYQRANDTGNLSFEDMQEMAEKGTLKGERVPAAVQEAAKVYTANGGSLYDTIESAKNGENDNELSAEDAVHARDKGLVGMTKGQAVDIFEKFQGAPMVGKISRDEMEEIATKGTFRGMEVGSEVRVAARVYMADDGALFDRVEQASNGESDGVLGRSDAANARRDGLIDV